MLSAYFNVSCKKYNQNTETRDNIPKNKWRNKTSLSEIEENIKQNRQIELSELKTVMEKTCDNNTIRKFISKGKQDEIEEVEPV